MNVIFSWCIQPLGIVPSAVAHERAMSQNLAPAPRLSPKAKNLHPAAIENAEGRGQDLMSSNRERRGCSSSRVLAAAVDQVSTTSEGTTCSTWRLGKELGAAWDGAFGSSRPVDVFCTLAGALLANTTHAFPGCSHGCSNHCLDLVQ